MSLPLELIRINFHPNSSFQFELYLRTWSEKREKTNIFLGTEIIADHIMHIEHLNKAEIRIPS